MQSIIKKLVPCGCPGFFIIANDEKNFLLAPVELSD
jgi:hypothetical protein